VELTRPGSPTTPTTRAPAVYFNYGVALGEIRDVPGAINGLRAAIRLKPDFYPPYINLGSLLDAQGQGERAVREWMALVNFCP